MRLLNSLILVLLLAVQAYSQQPAGKGCLFIIGGGSRGDALIKSLVTTAGLHKKDYIVVLPMASELPDTGYKYIKEELEKFTNAPVLLFDFRKRNVADKSGVDSLRNARLIYILGGDQNRFMAVVKNTPVYESIHAAFKNGSTIAGTSAGAAVMSRYMITGRQLKDTVYKETFDKLLPANIEFSEGLGLLQHTIIDQHFIKRSRYNRLLSALAAYPGYYGVGIDESTAIIVKGNKATVVGESQVLRLIAEEPVKVSSGGRLASKNIRLGIYTSGQTFDILP
ncbi:cyanophycinase [Niabella ginsenosidivorans]|nr:cyanophycinase [Niabella ginsenosidivorans]